MEINQYVGQVYTIHCKGRDFRKNEVLLEPVEVKVEIYKAVMSDRLVSMVKCFYNTGSSGQSCKASHPHVDKLDYSVACPYRFDI